MHLVHVCFFHELAGGGGGFSNGGGGGSSALVMTGLSAQAIVANGGSGCITCQ